MREPEPPNGEHKEKTPPNSEAGREGQDEGATSTLRSFNNVAPPMEKDFGTLVISEEGTRRYVKHNFWARVTEEVFL